MKTTWIIRCSFAGLLFLAAPWTGALRAASVNELKDDTGKTIIRYVVDAPDNIAPAGTTDPTKQVGLFLCFHEHDRPTGDEILPVRAALARLARYAVANLFGGLPLYVGGAARGGVEAALGAATLGLAVLVARDGSVNSDRLLRLVVRAKV